MISFSGTDLLTMDTKGRVALPARYRQPLSELCGARLKITLPAKPDDRLLVLYPLPEWDSVQAQLKALPSTCLLYTSPSPRDLSTSRMPSSA